MSFVNVFTETCLLDNAAVMKYVAAGGNRSRGKVVAPDKIMKFFELQEQLRITL